MLDTITETGIIDNDSSEREHIILSGEVNESITIEVTFVFKKPLLSGCRVRLYTPSNFIT